MCVYVCVSVCVCIMKKERTHHVPPTPPPLALWPFEPPQRVFAGGLCELLLVREREVVKVGVLAGVCVLLLMRERGIAVGMVGWRLEVLLASRIEEG